MCDHLPVECHGIDGKPGKTAGKPLAGATESDAMLVSMETLHKPVAMPEKFKGRVCPRLRFRMGVAETDATGIHDDGSDDGSESSEKVHADASKGSKGTKHCRGRVGKATPWKKRKSS